MNPVSFVHRCIPIVVRLLCPEMNPFSFLSRNPSIRLFIDSSFHSFDPQYIRPFDHLLINSFIRLLFMISFLCFPFHRVSIQSSIPRSIICWVVHVSIYFLWVLPSFPHQLVIHSIIHSFNHPFLRSFIHYLRYCFIPSLIHPSIQASIRLSLCTVTIHSSIPSFMYPSIHKLVSSFIHTSIQSFQPARINVIPRIFV